MSSMKQNVLKQGRRVVILLVLYMSAPLFVLVTNPHALPLPLLIVPFLWLFAVIFCSVWLVYRVVRHHSPSRKMQLSFGLVALVPVLLAVLQSIHQLSLKDIILVLGLVVIAGFYVGRLDIGQA